MLDTGAYYGIYEHYEKNLKEREFVSGKRIYALCICGMVKGLIRAEDRDWILC